MINNFIFRALGQGAFGEVYHGILKSKTDSSETNVAVKTLPELSTNQGKFFYNFLVHCLKENQQPYFFFL